MHRHELLAERIERILAAADGSRDVRLRHDLIVFAGQPDSEGHGSLLAVDLGRNSHAARARRRQGRFVAGIGIVDTESGNFRSVGRPSDALCICRRVGRIDRCFQLQCGHDPGMIGIVKCIPLIVIRVLIRQHICAVVHFELCVLGLIIDRHAVRRGIRDHDRSFCIRIRSRIIVIHVAFDICANSDRALCYLIRGNAAVRIDLHIFAGVFKLVTVYKPVNKFCTGDSRRAAARHHRRRQLLRVIGPFDRHGLLRRRQADRPAFRADDARGNGSRRVRILRRIHTNDRRRDRHKAALGAAVDINSRRTAGSRGGIPTADRNIFCGRIARTAEAVKVNHVLVARRNLELNFGVRNFALRAGDRCRQRLLFPGTDRCRARRAIAIVPAAAGAAEAQRDLPLRDRHAPGHARIMSVCVVRGSIVAFFFIRRDRCCAVAPAAAGSRQSRDRCLAGFRHSHADGIRIG